MASGSAPEKLCLRWVQAQALAALAHQVLVLPVDKNENFIQIKNLKR